MESPVGALPQASLLQEDAFQQTRGAVRLVLIVEQENGPRPGLRVHCPVLKAKRDAPEYGRLRVFLCEHASRGRVRFG